MGQEPSLFERQSPLFNQDKNATHGKVFILEKDTNGNGRIDIDDVQWSYLTGDGDFRSAEVCVLRDEADIIVTNPPFSLFREFLAWIEKGQKQFIMIGNINAITYKEVFKLIKENKIWTGQGFNLSLIYKTPYPNLLAANRQFVRAKGFDPDDGYVKVPGICWFTNLDHGRRHQPLQLMSMADNIRFSKHKEIRGIGYQKYDNYEAIEVPFTDAIPDDYNGVMGVPISFLDKYCPEQFQIVGLGNSRDNFTPNKDYQEPKKILKDGKIVDGGAINCVLTLATNIRPSDVIYYTSNNSQYLIAPYARILIKKKG